jgi:hypothetical protein
VCHPPCTRTSTLHCRLPEPSAPRACSPRHPHPRHLSATGGWLFFGLYAANQSWWFLTICLTVWAFLLVALSFWLTNQQFLSPVALVTAFIGERV